MRTAFLSLVLLASNAFAQTSSYKFHYPLNIGDYWEYEKRSGISIIESRRVIGDTLMPNGMTYRIIETSDLFGFFNQYQRIVDSTLVFQLYERFEPPNQIIYEEFLLYKLDLKIGDTWPYPPYGYDGFIADSGFVEVTELGETSLWSKISTFVVLGSFTMPDTGLWFDPDVMLVDSIGVREDSFEGGFLRLLGAIINNKQFGTITSVASSEHRNFLTDKFRSQIYPNPFNSVTTIEYTLNSPGYVRISIFNQLGQRVKVVDNRFRTPGFYKITWSGDNDFGAPVSSGIYFYLLELDKVVIDKERLTLIK